MSQANQRRAVILHVEHDPAQQDLARRVIGAAGIHTELHVVSNGREALSYLFRWGKYKDSSTSPQPDLVLLNLNVPKVSGSNVLKEIRADPELRRIVVILLSTPKSQPGHHEQDTEPANLDQLRLAVALLQRYWLQMVRV